MASPFPDTLACPCCRARADKLRERHQTVRYACSGCGCRFHVNKEFLLEQFWSRPRLLDRAGRRG